jgi:hypothetical protein
LEVFDRAERLGRVIFSDATFRAVYGRDPVRP